MPFVQSIPISMTALNYNIDADLTLGVTHGLTASWIRLLTGGIPPVQYIAPDSDNQSVTLFGGRVSTPGSGAQIIVTGNAGAPTPGDVYFVVPNTATDADITAMVLHGNLNLPYLDMKAHRIAGILDPTNAQDAATKNYCDTNLATKATVTAWASYTPTYVWTVAPASPTVGGRWCQIGKVVFWQTSYSSADSNAGVLQTISLPKTATNAGISAAVANGFTQNTNLYTPAPAAGYIGAGTPTVCTMAGFPVTIDGQVITVYMGGSYEVTT